MERVMPDGTFRFAEMERTEFVVTWTWGMLGTESLDLPPDANVVGAGRYVDWRRIDLRGGDVGPIEWSVSESAASAAREAMKALEQESRDAGPLFDDNPGRAPLPRKPL